MPDRLIMNHLLASAWAMHEPVLRNLIQVVTRHASGVRVPELELARMRSEPDDSGAEARLQTDDDPDSELDPSFQHTGIAIVPIQGVITKHSAMVNEISQPQGTSCDQIKRELRAAAQSDSIKAVLLDVYSPGGSVDGIADVARYIHRMKKPVIAHINDCGCSGAYWLACQANEIYVDETAVVGSIGVYSVLADDSQRVREQELTKVHLIRAGQFKGVGTSGVEINDEELEETQARVDAIYEVFIKHVALGLNISINQARELGDGRVYVGKQAVEAGLADFVGTFDGLRRGMVKHYS